jgi:DNA-binding transcriptional ArsR family regulator
MIDAALQAIFCLQLVVSYHRAQSLVFAELDKIPYLAKDKNMNLVFKALSDPTRRSILQLLRKRPMNAGELAEHFPIAKPTLSAHLAVLREADLVSAEKSGTVITYMLKVSVLEEVLLDFAQTVGVGLTVQPLLRKATGKAK